MLRGERKAIFAFTAAVLTRRGERRERTMGRGGDRHRHVCRGGGAAELCAELSPDFYAERRELSRNGGGVVRGAFAEWPC